MKEYCAWIPAADILQPSINNRCCHAVSDETEAAEYLAQTAQDPAKLAECLAWPNCAGTVKRRLEQGSDVDSFDMIKLTLRHDGTYAVDNGRHRVCFAKRTGVQQVWAKVVEWAPDESGYILPDILTNDEFRAELVTRRDEPWSGSELFVCGTAHPWIPVRFLVYKENEWVGVTVEPMGIRAFGDKPAPMMAMESRKRSLLAQLFTQAETVAVSLRPNPKAKGRLIGIGMAKYAGGRCVSFEVLHRAKDWTLGSWQYVCRTNEGHANPWFCRAIRQLPHLPVQFSR